MIQQLKAIYNGTRQPFSTLCWVHGFVVQVVMGHLEQNFTGTPSSRHCDARAVGKMVSSCSLANGLKCFACRLISLLITTDKIFFWLFLKALQFLQLLQATANAGKDFEWTGSQ